MKDFIFFILILFLLSCQSLPRINSPAFADSKKPSECPSPFLKQPSRLVHAVEVRFPGDVRSAAIGITRVDPVTRIVSCAIVTPEGMVLFEAESNGEQIKINRALPPFDSGDFAKSMLADIHLIFFPPRGRLHQQGFFNKGITVCRYLEDNGDWIDISENKDDGTQIKSYSSSGALQRHIRLKSTAGNVYGYIELRAKETFDYSLLMNLIEIQPVKSKP